MAVGDRILSLSNLDKVLYPETGFTKGEVVRYYAGIAGVMLAHLRGRCITLRRWPDGVQGPSFFEKRCPSHRPDWIPVSVGPGNERPTSRGRSAGDDSPIEYCRLEEPAALIWTANLAALELHAPMALAADLDTPTAVVIDLDPGAPATIIECCQQALELHALFELLGLVSVAKVSGSKGLQVYVPLNSPATHRECADFAHGLGQLLARRQPDAVTVNMAKRDRAGKVFIDWSQNSRHKTTIGAYSLRARSVPSVSAPLSWDEVADGATGAPLLFTAEDTLHRVERFGDLFAPVLTVEQELPV